MTFCLKTWLGLAIFFLIPVLKAAVLPEVLLLQQRSTTGQNRPITVPASTAPQQPVQVAPVVGLETIIGGVNPNAPRTLVEPPEEVEPPQVQQAVPQQPQQQQPLQPVQPPQPTTPAGPVVTRLEPSGPGLMLLFDNAPLNTVINLIMKELGYTYMVDPAVQGTVNIQTTQPIRREDLFATLELILKLNNAAIVKSGDIYLIVPIAEGIRAPHEILLDLKKRTEVVTPPSASTSPAATSLTPPVAAAPASQAPPAGPRVISAQGAAPVEDERGLVTVIIPLQFIPSSEMTTIIQPFMSGGAVVLSYDSKNILILTDYKTNIEKVKKLIEILDTQFFDINNTELVAIRYNRAADVAADLTKVFGGGGEASAVTLIAIERLNSILVIAHSREVLGEVHKWVEKLDSPTGGMNLQTFVYQVENSTAGNIAAILSQLYSDGAGLPSAVSGEGQAGEGQPGTAQQQRPGIQPAESRAPRRSLRSSLGPTLEGRPISERAAAGVGGSLAGGNVKIIVNEFNNSLIIQATEADYQYIERAIKQLDVLPRQVLIEAKVYSVQLSNDLSFGIAAFLQQRDERLATTGSISGPQGQSAGGALSAATRFILGDSRQIEAVLNTLRTRTKVELLEAPRLLAIDGQQATINIGAEVPVTTSSFGDPVVSGSAGAFLNQIQFRPTGTSLLINPRISAAGMVTMDLAIEISSATGTGLTPIINRNYVETSLIVKDGHTIAIGGIISDSESQTRNRIPLLGDLPLVGALFGQTSKNSSRRELVVLITPHVVGSVEQAEVTSSEFRRALRRAYGYIRDKEQAEDELIEDRARREVGEQQKRQEKVQKQNPQ